MIVNAIFENRQVCRETAAVKKSRQGQHAFLGKIRTRYE